MLCPKCKSWEVAAGAADRYCSWCGTSWLNVECRALNETLYFSPRERDDLQFELEVRNTGLIPLEILGVATEPLGCALFPAFVPSNQSATPTRLALAPGVSQRLAGRFPRATMQALFSPQNMSGNGRALPASFETATEFENASVAVRFVLLLADDMRGPETTITILPRPEFELLTQSLEVFEEGAASATLPASMPVRIRLHQGFAQVRDMSSNVAGLTFTRMEKSDVHEAAENGVLDFHLEIERALVLRHLQSGQPLRAELKLLCENSEAAFVVRNAPLQIVPHRVPRLRILGAQRSRVADATEIQTWALAGRARDYTLQLKNENEHEVALHAIEATGSLECLKRKALDLPLQLAPGATLALPFVIAAQEFKQNTTITGTLALRYHAEGAPFTTECNMRIVVRTPQPFAGVAALDFGAAQSCVAVAATNEAAQARLLKIQNDHFVPTALVYQNIETNGARHYAIGHEALSAKSGKEAALHVVQDFKQFLGSTQSRQVYLTREQRVVTLAYRDLLADYLQALLSAAEERLAEELFQRQLAGEATDFTQCQLRDLVFVTPTAFTYKQKEGLRQLLAELGIASENNIQLVPAPVLSACSALKFLLPQWQREAQSGENTSATRHILVYEMGAGATEMALVQFTSKPQKNAAAFDVEIKISGSEGDEQFGGNNLTAALAKYLAQQALAQFEQRFGANVVLPLWHRVGQTPSKRLEHVGYLNWKRLRRYAESLKCQFADLTLPARITMPRLTLQIVLDKNFQAAHVENLVLHSAMLEKVVAARMELHVRRLQNLLRRANVTAPDRVLLAGKSVLLPGVHKLLAAAFASAGCEVEYVDQMRASASHVKRTALPSLRELKAAAALGGASFLGLLKNSGVLRFPHAEPLMKTVMRLGFGVGNNFLPVIEKNVPIGRECAVPPFALTWESEVPIYATTNSGEPQIETEAELLGRFTLMQFKPALPPDLEEDALQRALQLGRLRLRLTPHRELQVLLRLRGREHAIYFELD